MPSIIVRGETVLLTWVRQPTPSHVKSKKDEPLIEEVVAQGRACKNWGQLAAHFREGEK